MEKPPEIKEPEEELDLKLPLFLGEQATKDWWIDTQHGPILRFGEQMLEDF